ncbi:glycosyltransferase family 9 protein [bacterium]|nr:glycosyltransferase family 9 protein [bacterium]
MDRQEPQRVLVFCLSGLGDAIMMSPALAAVAARPDRYRLTLLTMFRWVADYLREQQFTNDVRWIDFMEGSKREVFAQLLALRRERFDVSVVAYPQNRREYNGVNFVIGARQRIGFRYHYQGWANLPFLNHVVLPEQTELQCVQENLRWAAHLLGTTPEQLPDDLVFRYPPAAEAAAGEFLRTSGLRPGAPLIGIHASCHILKNQQNRCWPPGSFAELLQRLGRRVPGAQFFLLEGPSDAAVTGAICQIVPTVPVARKLPMPVVRALIGQCDLFLCNLSGLMHIAAAARTPTVAIYGPTNPVWDHPWKTEHTIVNQHLPCSPCFRYGSRPLSCPAGLDYACVRELPVEMVEQATLELLERVRR